MYFRRSRCPSSPSECEAFVRGASRHLLPASGRRIQRRLHLYLSHRAHQFAIAAGASCSVIIDIRISCVASVRAISPVTRPSRIVTMRSDKREDLRQLGGDDDHRDAGLGHLDEQIVHLDLRADVDAARRLVDDQDLRAAAQASAPARPSADCRRKGCRPPDRGSPCGSRAAGGYSSTSPFSLRSSMNQPARLIWSCAAMVMLVRIARLRNSACFLRSSGTRPMPARIASRGQANVTVSPSIGYRPRRTRRRRRSPARSRCGRRRRGRRGRGSRPCAGVKRDVDQLDRVRIARVAAARQAPRPRARPARARGSAARRRARRRRARPSSG